MSAASSTAKSSLRPAFSDPLRTRTPFAVKEKRTDFGKSWRELVLDVSAFRFKFSDGNISSIKNIVKEDLPKLNALGHPAISPRTSMFQLLDGEYIVATEIREGRDYVHALRFHTNLRVTLWFGQPKGESVRVVRAPDGCKIRSLFGAWGVGLRELGAVFEPLSQCESEAIVEEIELLRAPPVLTGAFQVPFRIAKVDIGAIVTKIDSDVKWIQVLSRQQFADLMGPLGGLYPGENEHWLDLFDGESLIKVEVAHNGAVIKGIRFTTTKRSTTWMGQSPSPLLSHIVANYDGISGFFGTIDGAGIVSFGLLVKIETLSTANTSESTEIASAETANDMVALTTELGSVVGDEFN